MNFVRNNPEIISFMAIIAAICGGLGWFIYEDCQREGFELKKADWACTRSHTEIQTHYIYAGKVLIPQTQIIEVCDQWSRR